MTLLALLEKGGDVVPGQVGNIEESLNFRDRAGDKVLDKHVKTCGKNHIYISKTSRNKVISYCGEVFTDKLLRIARLEGVIADEAADKSPQEQMRRRKNC